MKLPTLLAAFAALLTISLLVSRHDQSVAPLRRALGQRSSGRGMMVAASPGREGDSTALAVQAAAAPVRMQAETPVQAPVIASVPIATASAVADPILADGDFAPVESMLPGNAVRASGRTVAVRGFRQVPGATGVALAVSVSGISPSGASPESSADTRVQAREEAIASSRPRRGLSYEEQLFRTKWGWSAFADVQHAALEAHSD